MYGGDCGMLTGIYLIIVLGLGVLFFVSFFLFIKGLSKDSSIRRIESVKNGKKLDLIIEQNEKIISLLENDKS